MTTTYNTSLDQLGYGNTLSGGSVAYSSGVVGAPVTTTYVGAPTTTTYVGAPTTTTYVGAPATTSTTYVSGPTASYGLSNLGYGGASTGYVTGGTTYVSPATTSYVSGPVTTGYTTGYTTTAGYGGFGVSGVHAHRVAAEEIPVESRIEYIPFEKKYVEIDRV